MTRGEIESCLTVGRLREVRVFQDQAPGISGYARTITVHSGNRVQVAYEVQGHEEGGAYFWATYPSLDEVLVALEDFIGVPVANWRLQPLPARSGPPDHAALAAALRRGSLSFPPAPPFRLKSSYWEQFLSQED